MKPLSTSLATLSVAAAVLGMTVAAGPSIRSRDPALYKRAAAAAPQQVAISPHTAASNMTWQDIVKRKREEREDSFLDEDSADDDEWKPEGLKAGKRARR